MTSPGEPTVCRTCDGTGYVETAPPDSRVIHQEPCPDCDGPAQVAAPSSLVRALAEEYAAARARSGFWRDRWSDDFDCSTACHGARDVLVRVAERLGVTDLPAQAAVLVARGTTGEEG